MPHLLTIDQFQDLVVLLDSNLAVSQALHQCDIHAHWKLHSVSPICNLSAPSLLAPRLQHGRVSCVFYDFESRLVSCDAGSAHCAQLFYNVLRGQTPIPLQVRREDPLFLGAADAFATAEKAGIGGWWVPKHLEHCPENARWFQFTLETQNLPVWFRTKESGDLQKCIAALEGHAQVVLLVLRAQDAQIAPGSSTLVFAHLCDNQGTTAASAKMLSLKQPMDFVLQALGYFCCRFGVALHMTDIAGERNIWADELSRGAVPRGFAACNQRSLDLTDLLQQLWRRADGGAGCCGRILD